MPAELGIMFSAMRVRSAIEGPLPCCYFSVQHRWLRTRRTQTPLFGFCVVGKFHRHEHRAFQRAGFTRMIEASAAIGCFKLWVSPGNFKPAYPGRLAVDLSGRTDLGGATCRYRESAEATGSGRVRTGSISTWRHTTRSPRSTFCGS